MTKDVETSFLTYYVRSLAERSRVEKSGTKFGFDWIIYNLALADGLTPHRLPFLRGSADEMSKTKTGPEFGIDASFLSPDRKTLTIFVLKDEVLNNSNWKNHDFDHDLRAAASPDLGSPDFADVEEVRLILTYNKDEDDTGCRLFTNLTSSLGSSIQDNIRLSFDRWNLTKLVEKVGKQLLSPSLLPQKFFSQFTYLCSQFGDFRHGSDEWEQQLIPNWRRFLDELLRDIPDERSVRLLPVALLILRQHGEGNKTVETGWIDLAEWAMLKAWEVARTTSKDAIRQAVTEMWIGFYIAELDRFYAAHADELSSEHAIDSGAGDYVDCVANTIRAFWHLARQGILVCAIDELLPDLDEQNRPIREESINKGVNRLVAMLNASPACHRPLIDLHHVELFLLWRAFWRLGREEDIERWLYTLRANLCVRRAGSTKPLPFIEGGNSLDLVFEAVATDEKPPELNEQSSLLILFLLEICLSLDNESRDGQLAFIYQHIVLGRDSYGEQMEDTKPLDLMGWAPPDDWIENVLTRPLACDGECQTLDTLDSKPVIEPASVAEQIRRYVQQCRDALAFSFPETIPESVIVLACLKHRSPLPPEYWRRRIFQN